MFRKETELGEGAYGTVYKVKCLKTSVISADGSSRVSMDGINAGSLRRKLNMRAEGVNMSSSDGKKTTLVRDIFGANPINCCRRDMIDRCW